MDKCDIAIQLNQSLLYKFLNTIHLASCILTILFSFHLYRSWRSRVYFHANVKILLNTMLLFAVTHALTMTCFLLMNIVSWLRFNGSCESIMFDGATCLVFRHPTNICIGGLVLCQLSIAAERVFATWIGPSYNTYSNQIGRYLSGFTVVCGFVLLTPLLIAESTTEDQINCGFPSDSGVGQNFVLQIELLSLDFTAVIVFVLVYGVNKYKKTGAKFQLEKRYQINETLYVTKTLLPVTFLHFALFAVLCAANVVIEMIYKDPFQIIYYEVIFYTAPFYTMLFPLIVLHVIHRLDENRKSKVNDLVTEEVSGDPGVRAHFQSLDKMWGTPIKAKNQPQLYPMPTPV